MDFVWLVGGSLPEYDLRRPSRKPCRLFREGLRMGRSTEVTSLIEAWGRGDASALDRLIPMVYDDLRKVAGRRLRMEREGHTLSATALVHETYLRLMGQQPSHLENRSHFFAVASELMRRILVDHARRRAASKRGGGAVRLTLDPELVGGAAPDLDLVALDDALSELATLDPRQARIVELRFFGGLSAEEAAMVLGISRATVERDWGLARAWLYRRLQNGPAASS